MLEHDEPQEDLIAFDFECYVPESWGQPRYWLSQRLQYLLDNRLVYGTITGIMYDDISEEWQYEVSLAPAFRDSVFNTETLTHLSYFSETALALEVDRVKLHRMLTNA
jgi:hypothetical protein